jgi:cyclophilin family peptidyl-prolyl cis-trans isomerase
MLRPRLAASIFSCSLLPCLACTEPPQTCDTACADAGTGTESEGETNETGDGDGDGDAGDGDGDGDTSSACDSDTPIVVLETSMGTMVAQLDRVRAPITVDNFTTYVDMGFYDGTIFHRVINGFVIQGGGFEPGLVLKETLGTIPLEIHPELRHVDGAIAMARSQQPDTAESQFYITDGAQPGLDDNYAVFGVLIDGLAVRDAITMVATGTVPWMDFELMDVPVTDVVLDAAYCVESWP